MSKNTIIIAIIIVIRIALRIKKKDDNYNNMNKMRAGWIYQVWLLFFACNLHYY